MYDFARYAIRKREQFPFEWMHSHSISISNNVVRGCKTKAVGFLRVQISSNGKMCFVVPVSHLRKQALHVTARDISHEPPKGKTNSGTTWTAVAPYPIDGSFTSSCWLPCDKIPHCLDYLDHACLRYLKPEAWPPKSPDLNHIMLRLGTRFVGRGRRAQNKRSIPLESWRLADSRNVNFLKIYLRPFLEMFVL